MTAGSTRWGSGERDGVVEGLDRGEHHEDRADEAGESEVELFLAALGQRCCGHALDRATAGTARNLPRLSRALLVVSVAVSRETSASSVS